MPLTSLISHVSLCRFAINEESRIAPTQLWLREGMANKIGFEAVGGPKSKEKKGAPTHPPLEAKMSEGAYLSFTMLTTNTSIV